MQLAHKWPLSNSLRNHHLLLMKSVGGIERRVSMIFAIGAPSAIRNSSFRGADAVHGNTSLSDALFLLSFIHFIKQAASKTPASWQSAVGSDAMVTSCICENARNLYVNTCTCFLLQTILSQREYNIISSLLRKYRYSSLKWASLISFRGILRVFKEKKWIRHYL